MNKILIIEDSPDIQIRIKWGLSKELGVLQAIDRKSALRLFKKNLPKVVTLNLGLPPDNSGTSEGFACLKEIMEEAPHTKVIVITGNNDRENALRAVQMGAYDYYLKPIDMNEIKVIIGRAFYLSEIEDEIRNLHLILDKDIGFAGMVGQCPQMQRIFDTLKKVVATDVTVLLTGESGTGKELAAKIIHEKSSRSKEEFIFINCGAIPEEFLKSEIFSQEERVILNASKQQGSKFKGTLFLDEISKMPIEYQTKLVKFLDKKRIQHGNENQDAEIDVRIIAATNADLQKAIKEGKFREDLFYRLSVITINLPPLRERGRDIMLLANTFLERYKEEFRKKIRGFSLDAVNVIKNYSWLGNIRELENKIQRAVIMSDSNFIEPHILGLAEAPLSSVMERRYENITLKEARKRLEMELIEIALTKHRGNITYAADELGVSRPTLYDLITKYGLNTKYTLE